MTRNRQTSRAKHVRKLTTLGNVSLTSALYLFCTGAAYAQQWQATQDIAATAERFVLQQANANGAETTVQAANIDSRHRLAHCSEALEPFLRRGSTIQARTIVGVRCSSPKPWKIYVPVDVIVTQAILTTSRALPKGHVLEKSDLTRVKRDVARLRSGYLQDFEHAIGLRLKAPLIGGKVLTPAMLQASVLIHRGQSVTLVVGSGGFRIQVKGKALMDGALKQRIRVENSSSGRVVEGIVRSAEHVEILTSSSAHLMPITPKDLPALADTRLSNNDR